MEFAISEHLIIPFGVEKWKIEDIRVVGVSTSKTFFRTDIPVVHIDKSKKAPLRIIDYYKNINPLPRMIKERQMHFSHI